MNQSMSPNAIASILVAVILGLIVIIGIIAIKACESKPDNFDECVSRGVLYYIDIDSYPYLKSENISATDKAKQLCRNAPDTAFK